MDCIQRQGDLARQRRVCRCVAAGPITLVKHATGGLSGQAQDSKNDGVGSEAGKRG